MRFEPLYRVRFTYPESWMVGPEDGWEQHLLLAEGRCEGSISGRFRGANFPHRRTAAGPFRPDSAPSSTPTTGRRSCSSGMDMAVPTHRGDGRLSAPSFI